MSSDFVEYPWWGGWHWQADVGWRWHDDWSLRLQWEAYRPLFLGCMQDQRRFYRNVSWTGRLDDLDQRVWHQPDGDIDRLECDEEWGGAPIRSVGVRVTDRNRSRRPALAACRARAVISVRSRSVGTRAERLGRTPGLDAYRTQSRIT